MSEAEYDESLMPLLIKNRFNPKNISKLMHIAPGYLSLVYCFQQNILAAVNMLKEQFKDGCIFTLPSGRRNNMFFVYHTIATSNEIRRRLDLKAFL